MEKSNLHYLSKKGIENSCLSGFLNISKKIKSGYVYYFSLLTKMNNLNPNPKTTITRFFYENKFTLESNFEKSNYFVSVDGLWMTDLETRVIHAVSRHIFIPVLLFLCLLSCSESNENIGISNDVYLMPVYTTIESYSIPANLKCNLYVFSKSEEVSDYELEESMSLINGSENKIRFVSKDAINKKYRFLFVVTQHIDPDVYILHKNGNTLQADDKWNDVMIRANKVFFSGQNYYDILDQTGMEILDQGIIKGNLSHILYQDLFETFSSASGMFGSLSAESSAILFPVEKLYGGGWK